MPPKNNKRSLLYYLLATLGLLLASLLSVVAAGLGFFLAARVTNSLLLITAASALALLLSASGAAWLITRSTPWAVGYGAAVFIVVAMLANYYLFRPIGEEPSPPVARADTQYWDLPTGSRVAYTHFAAVGTPQPAPIIYLHGGPATPIRPSNYAFYQQLTQDGFDVYLYDQAGSGLSAPLPHIQEYVLARHVADLEAIRQQLGVPQLILSGTSWGAVLASHYMAAYPDHVSAAVFISPGVLGDRSQVRYDYSRTASAEDDSIILPPLRMIAAGFLARVNPTAAQQFAPPSELNAVYDGFITGPSLEYQANCRGYRPDPNQPSRGGGGNYYANLLTLQSLKQAADPQPLLQTNQTPVLILRGECDYIPWTATYRYKETFSKATLVLIEQAGHALLSTQPEIALATMRAFLTGKPLPLPAHTSHQPPP